MEQGRDRRRRAGSGGQPFIEGEDGRLHAETEEAQQIDHAHPFHPEGSAQIAAVNKGARLPVKCADDDRGKTQCGAAEKIGAVQTGGKQAFVILVMGDQRQRGQAQHFKEEVKRKQIG